MKKIPKRWLDCDCGDPEHVVRVSILKHGPFASDVDFVLEPRVNFIELGFLRRAWYALQILLGRQPNFFADILLSENSVDELSKLIVTYRIIKKLRRAKESKKGGDMTVL